MQPLTLIHRTLQHVELLGNKLPHPTLLFIYLCGLILLLSALISVLGISATHPLSGETIYSVNLLSRQGLHQILLHTVTNFTHFAPVGSVLVAIMGIAVAEHSGLIATLLTASVRKTPRQLLCFIVVLTGVLSSLAMDTGYVVLIPLAALVFIAAGRHPVAGIAAAFAGVSGGFSANLLIGPLDAILAGISTESAALIAADYQVTAAANYYFMIVSTLLISLVGTLVTEKIVVPSLGKYHSDDKQNQQQLGQQEKWALYAVAAFTLLFIAVILWGLLPGDGILRDIDGGDILRSPFIQGIVIIISAYAAVAGLIFGKVSGNFKRKDDFIHGMETSMSGMASYLVLMFFAAQFVSYFNWSQLGAIAAINGAKLLQSMPLNASALMVCFIFMTALINLLIGSASAKWALLAPIFVPMFLLVGITPEATQVAYRIGDSTTNIISPLMPYLGVVIAFVQRYNQRAGLGTVIAMMLPYSLAFLFSWSALLMVWILMDWPLGPGSPIFMHASP